MPASRRPLLEVAALFLKLGTIAFGGPAVHVAMMRDEAVVRRGWLDEQEFLDGLGVTSTLPGPGSTQMSMVIGRRRAGWPGLVVGGVSFILPAFCVVLLLAWAYVHYGHSTVGSGVLYGIKPVVIAVVADALWGLRRVALRGAWPAALAVAAFAGYLLGANVLVVLLGAGIVLALVRTIDRRRRPHGGAAALVPLAPTLAAALRHRPGNGAIFAEFVKLGIVVFGSGYVLLAFLRRDLVNGLGWLGIGPLLDAVAVGQLTPGPVFTTATFIGYLLGGVPGAVLATLGIFLPSFFMVAVAAPQIPRLRRVPLTAAVLDGVNAAALGLMAGVGVDLARSALTGVVPVVLALAAALALVRFRVNSAWIVLGGAVAGILHAVA
jgi:chromate transporter